MAAWQDQGGRTLTAQVNGSTPWAQGYAREIRDLINRQADRAPRSVQAHLGPSELGIRCDRQVIGKMVGPVFPGTKKTNHISDKWPATIGTAVHAWLAQALTDENARIGAERFLAELRVAPVLQHPGTTDFYDRMTATIGDWKVLGPTSMAKIRSPAGPPRVYRVQLLLYWLGCLNAGLPARRIALIALPRTAPTLDSMYVWEHVPGPEDIDLLAEVLRITAIRRDIATDILKGVIRIEEVPVTPGDECFFCLVPSSGPRPRPTAAPAALAPRPRPSFDCPSQSTVLSTYRSHPPLSLTVRNPLSWPTRRTPVTRPHLPSRATPSRLLPSPGTPSRLLPSRATPSTPRTPATPSRLLPSRSPCPRPAWATTSTSRARAEVPCSSR